MLWNYNEIAAIYIYWVLSKQTEISQFGIRKVLKDVISNKWNATFSNMTDGPSTLWSFQMEWAAFITFQNGYYFIKIWLVSTFKMIYSVHMFKPKESQDKTSQISYESLIEKLFEFEGCIWLFYIVYN